MSKRRSYEEPWSPQAMIVDALIDHSNRYVSSFTKRQAKALAEAWALLDIISSKVVSKEGATWLEKLLLEFEMRLKFVNGWAVKEASRVARSGATRFMLNLSRWKRILMGSEE